MHCKRVIIGDVHLLNRRYRQPVSTHWSQEQTHLLFPPLLDIAALCMLPHEFIVAIEEPSSGRVCS